MKLVYDIAQQCEDSFYQSFRPASAFFTLEDFALSVINERDDLLDQEFRQLWNYNQQRNKGNNSDFINVNPQWVITIKEEIKYDDENKNPYVDICKPLYEFPSDEFGNGVQSVSPVGGGCTQFVRIMSSTDWQICMTATNEITFYSLEGCRIFLHNFNGCCKSLSIRIIPSQSALPINEQTVPDGKAAHIIEVVLQKMFRSYQAKLGKIEMVNQQNPNPSPNETSTLYPNLTTK